MTMMRFVACLFLLNQTLFAQQNFAKVKVTSQKLSDSIGVLMGAGGNIGVSFGSDGVFLIDDQYAPLNKKILQALKGLSAKPVRYVINTHWHGDHTGGNEAMAKKGSVIVAHENVHKRMSAGQVISLFKLNVPPAPATALPVITFNDEMNFYLNNDEIKVAHVENAHTDGDSFVIFKKGNVIHMGDVYFNGLYPFIDLSSGGSIQGMIAAVEKALLLIDEKTKVIPGHGPVSNKEELINYLNMLKYSRDAVESLVQQKRSVEEVVKAAPTKAYDRVWGNGFIKPNVFVKTVYESLTQ